MDKNPGSATVKTPSANFTGDVWLNPVFSRRRHLAAHLRPGPVHPGRAH